MSATRILVVDDEADIRELVAEILEDEGYAVMAAADAAEARARKREWQPELVLLDIWMPGEDGISLLRGWGEAGELDASVVMMSGHGNIETAVEATRLGAWDFIEKPIALAKLLLTVERALEVARLSRQNAELRRQLREPVEPIGASAVMRELRARGERLAALDTHVLIAGERGSGKQSLARWLHSCSARAGGPFVTSAVGGMTSADLRVALLGKEDQPGALERAAGGTLLIAEFTELDAELQALLAGILERGSVQRQGDSAVHPVDARVMATTSADVAALMRAGELREELYYQLNVASITVPPLREHAADVPELLRHFAGLAAQRDRLPERQFPDAVCARLARHDWPGNVRELRALVQRLLVLDGGPEVTLEEAEAALAPTPTRSADGRAHLIDLGEDLRTARERFERDYLSRQLRLVGGNVSQLAARAGLERTHVYRKLRDLGIDLKRDGSR